MGSLSTFRTDVERPHKRELSQKRSKVTEIPLSDACFLLPARKEAYIDNEVNEFRQANSEVSNSQIVLVEKEYDLFKALYNFYHPFISCWNLPLSKALKCYRLVSYLHADYCSNFNDEALKVIKNLHGKLSPNGAVLRFTHSRRKTYDEFHAQEGKYLLQWMLKQKVLSDEEYFHFLWLSSHNQTDPTLRVGMQLIIDLVVGEKTLKDPTRIGHKLDFGRYEITHCVADRYKDTSPMETMRFVMKPVKTPDLSMIRRSLYKVYNGIP